MLIESCIGRCICAVALVAALAGCGGGGGGSGSGSGGAGSGALPLITGSGSWPPPVQLSSSIGCVTNALTAPVGSTTYNVGPGETYTDLQSVPWLSLKPGDVVNIFYRAQPYATIVAITGIGTATAPIVINGVTDNSCNRPVITGQNARIANDALTTGYWTSNPGSYILGSGLLNFSWAPGVNVSPATEPAYIIVQNLELTGAKTGNTYTGPTGSTAQWSGSSGLYAVDFAHVTIQNCLIHGNDSGVFFNSQDPSRTSSYVTLRQNIIYGNGLAGSYSDHNVYGQGYRTLYEGNWLGQEIPQAVGSTLKDRSSGTVIRYNYIVASARAVDLVDSETDQTVIDDPLYNYAWMYGNIIVDDFSLSGPNSALLIHWGGDSGVTSNYRNGTLYAYFNTFIVSNISVSGANPSPEFEVFDMPLASETVDARSNIFYFQNDSGYWPEALGGCCGTINLNDTNWMTTGAVGQQPASSSNGTLVVNTNGAVIYGVDPLLDASWLPKAGSPVIGHGVVAPTAVPASDLNLANLQPTAQFGTAGATSTNSGGNPSVVSRSAVSNLGARE